MRKFFVLFGRENAGLAALTLLFATGFVSACGSDEEPLPTVDCQSGPVPTYTQIKPTSLAKCTSCHSSTSQGVARAQAPADINFDTYAAAKKDAKGAASEVNAGAMPLAGFPTLSEVEKQALYKWALCGTPE